jgi:hypothetical protein
MSDPYDIIGTDSYDGYKFSWSFNEETKKYRLILHNKYDELMLHRFSSDGITEYDNIEDLKCALAYKFVISNTYLNRK